MGGEARAFLDELASMGFSRWQVLPLVPADEKGSPYCSLSAFAGDPVFIDPRGLATDGLLTEEELGRSFFRGSPHSADREFAAAARKEALKLAFGRGKAELAGALSLFAEQNPWVVPYALFMKLKDKNDGLPWWEWSGSERRFSAAAGLADLSDESQLYYVFEQFVFLSQWRALKEYANSKGISVIGDMPIYVSRDSVDVWADVDQFLLDRDTLSPKKVAGVPPDYFSEEGQLWGNPLYDWEAMERDGWRWWLRRMEHAGKLFDVVRIDHFRAFASYWAIPSDSETAKNGEWLKGPGMRLFSAIGGALPELRIVAEDLGTFGEDVVKLLDDSGFPGMRVIQFGFDPNGDSTHLPHNYPKNCVAYVGTHDNNTILGWLWGASKEERAYALRYCCFGGSNWGEGGARSPSCRAVIEAVWRSSAETAVVAFQDMAGYGEDARMNTPGTSEGNWLFRTTAEDIGKIDKAYFKEINHIYRR